MRTLAALLLLPWLMQPAQAETIDITDFDHGLAGWEAKSFQGTTRYRLVRDGDTPCIRAEADASASGLFRRLKIDLEQTPWLEWSWKIDRLPDNHKEREKTGDDFVARIYLIVSGGLLFWNTRALNYVWASHEPAGAAWDNPYTDHSAMLAVESGADHAGRWRSYRRNVRKDLQRLFGQDIRHIDAVAIMTDTDNTGLRAGACYGGIRFTDG